MENNKNNNKNFLANDNPRENGRKKDLKDVLRDIIKHRFGIDFREYKKSALIILILLGIVFFLYAVGFIRLDWDFWKSTDSGLPTTEVSPSDYYSDFIDEKWVEHLGKFYRSFNDLNHIFLFPETPRALLKFHKPLPERREIEFKFSPLSEDAANIVINVGNLYEIVIGDNNYKTVSVKARIGPDEKWESIPEKQSGLLTKDMTGGMRKDSDVIMKINTEYHLDGNYFLDLKIKHIPIAPPSAGLQNFHGQYIFTVPFQEYKPLDISVGLINPKLKAGVGARFISFKIEE